MVQKHCSFTVMTYNVHRLIGTDRVASAARIARVIDTYRPDVVAIQELPGGRYRPEENGCDLDLVAELAKLEPPFPYHERERCGNVVLSRFPMRLVRAGGLHPETRRRSIVPRGALWVEIEICGHKLQLVNTHLGLTPPERASQVKVLAGKEWLQHHDCHPPIVLCGDFNALPSSSLHRRLKGVLNDEQEKLGFGHTEWTFPSHRPIVRFDHLFVSPSLKVDGVEIPQTELTRVASDHLPLLVKLSVK